MIDSKHVGTIDGFDINAVLVPDTDTSTDNYDCYTPKQVAAFNRHEWSFVGTIVTASKAGILGCASLWGSEHGFYVVTDEDDNEIRTEWVSPLDGDGDDFINGYGPGLIDEAIAIAQAKLKELAE
jgi:hypothetical protein